MSHIMTITDGVPEFVFTAPADAKCHQYPDCECEQWGDDHEHPTVTHATCWLAQWYALGTGDTAEMYLSDSVHPLDAIPQNAKGEIEIEFDECPLWYFTDLTTALAASTTALAASTTEGARS